MPPQSPPHVRAAGVADLAAIGAIQARAWQIDYAAVLPAQTLQTLDPHDLAERWRAAVTRPPSDAHAVLVAVGDDLVLGFAAVDDSGEIVTLEVDPAHHRRGHGSRLLAALADHGRAHGLPALRAWCPLTDETRRAFFTSAGFAPSGGIRDLTGTIDGTTEGPTEGPGTRIREAELVAGLAEVSAAAPSDPGPNGP